MTNSTTNNNMQAAYRYVLKKNNHYDVKYFTNTLKTAKMFPSSQFIYIETKSYLPKVFKCQNQIPKSKHVFAPSIAKK